MQRPRACPLRRLARQKEAVVEAVHHAGRIRDAAQPVEGPAVADLQQVEGLDRLAQDRQVELGRIGGRQEPEARSDQPAAVLALGRGGKAEQEGVLRPYRVDVAAAVHVQDLGLLQPLLQLGEIGMPLEAAVLVEAPAAGEGGEEGVGAARLQPVHILGKERVRKERADEAPRDARVILVADDRVGHPRFPKEGEPPAHDEFIAEVAVSSAADHIDHVMFFLLLPRRTWSRRTGVSTARTGRSPAPSLSAPSFKGGLP